MGAPRQNEYFLPRDGIDREVIQADICRYLGNDALVRPGTYEDPATRQPLQGYYITAYRNLTSAMIDDLKNDSARWEQERRMQQASRIPGGHYRSSDTYARRNMSGPSGGSQYDDRDQYNTPRYPGSDAPGYSGNPSSQSSSGYGQAQGQYAGATGSQYPAAAAGGSQYAGYGAQGQYAPQDSRYGQAMPMGGYPPQPDANSGSYVSVGANRTVANPQGYRPQYDSSGDVMMSAMTTGVSNPSVYATAGGQAGYNQAYYSQQHAAGYGQQAAQPVQQPLDTFMGRKGADPRMDPRADPRTTSPGTATAPATYPGPSAGHASPSYPSQTQYDDREQPQSRSSHQGGNNSSSRHKESRTHHSSRHDKYR